MDELEWEVFQTRANEAAARLLWRKGNIALSKRINHIFSDTLVNRGDRGQYGSFQPSPTL